jgi:hypothetical protein
MRKAGRQETEENVLSISSLPAFLLSSFHPSHCLPLSSETSAPGPMRKACRTRVPTHSPTHLVTHLPPGLSKKNL